MSPAIRRKCRLPAAGALALALTGCVLDDADRPRPAPAAPADAPVERIFLSTDAFSQDRNGNQFYDTFTCVVYLFPPPAYSDLPMHSPGSMVFELRDEEDYLIARWELGPDETRAVSGVHNGLAGYLLSLDISQVGDDRVISRRAELTCEFIPAAPAGRPTRSPPVPVQQIGPMGTGALRR